MQNDILDQKFYTKIGIIITGTISIFLTIYLFGFFNWGFLISKLLCLIYFLIPSKFLIDVNSRKRNIIVQVIWFIFICLLEWFGTEKVNSLDTLQYIYYGQIYAPFGEEFVKIFGLICLYRIYELILFNKEYEHKKQIGFIIDILIVSVLWAFEHRQYDLIEKIPIFISGILYFSVFLTTESIFIPILCHIINNYSYSVQNLEVLFYFLNFSLICIPILSKFYHFFYTDLPNINRFNRILNGNKFYSIVFIFGSFSLLFLIPLTHPTIEYPIDIVKQAKHDPNIYDNNNLIAFDKKTISIYHNFPIGIQFAKNISNFDYIKIALMIKNDYSFNISSKNYSLMLYGIIDEKNNIKSLIGTAIITEFNIYFEYDFQIKNNNWKGSIIFLEIERYIPYQIKIDQIILSVYK